MIQSLVTIVAPLDPADLSRAEAILDRLGNPVATPLQDALDTLDPDGAGTHFVSLHALPSFTPGKAFLVLELTGDGTVGMAVGRLVTSIERELSTVFALATDWDGTDLCTYLLAHNVTTGFGLGDNPGLGHSGSPGMTVGRIRSEAVLVEQITGWVAEPAHGRTALERVEAIRGRLAAAGETLDRADAPPDFVPQGVTGVVAAAIGSFAMTYLWPFAALLLLGSMVAALTDHGLPQPANALAFIGDLVRHFLRATPFVLVAIVLTAVLLLWRLRVLEARDYVSQRAPDMTIMQEILARENHGQQNHMISLTEVKPGLLRAFTMRLAFWGVATLGPRLFRPGYLGPIGTIDFARWIQIPGTRDFLFLSNYGGSWEAYLEDFITLAHLGLTGVWSNTLGFPRTRFLVLDGATDGERFKRYARQSMRPTRFWYSAYPQLITDMVRANAEVRRGLSGAMTEDDAQAFLSRFGSNLRPRDRLQTREIQSLLFGGMGFLPALRLTTWRFGVDEAANRRFIGRLLADTAFGDGRKVRDDPGRQAAFQVAFSADGLRRLGLPETALGTFPTAFRDGMTGPHRARILGDVAEDDAENWWWGQEADDVAVLILATTPMDLDELAGELQAVATDCGVTLASRVETMPYDPANNKEPFGFDDGGSQPVIAGTYKGTTRGDPMHLVEPGEFILGYPDNRGNLPPVPVLDAIFDPANLLPTVKPKTDFATTTVDLPRDLGRNGSFLVIRQLEQYVDRFNNYCAEEARRLEDAAGPPYAIDAEFIAAKMMGRWRNNAPLVRSPYSASRSPEIMRENSFTFAEDPEGHRCPFGSHIRRANPRDSLNPGSTDQVAISNRHRLLRVGRKYAPQEGQHPGLLFMALNADIERQFEFVQQTWLRGSIISLRCPSSFVGEGDPLLGRRDGSGGPFTIPTNNGPLRLAPTPRFISMRGGGYYFLPSRSLINWLVAKSSPA